MNRKLWVIALAIWLVLYGILTLSNIRFEMQNFVMGGLAVIAGVLLVFDR